MGEEMDSHYTEGPSPAMDDGPHGPLRPATPVMVIVAVGVVLALAAGVVVFMATRDQPAPMVQITTTPVPVPTVPVAVATPPIEAAPTAADSFDPAPQVATPAQPPPPTPASTPSSTPTSDVILTPGDPAGSGCTPGPSASLPDGQWAGYIVEYEPSLLRFDLACFNSTTGAVTNENTALRDVALAPDASVMCGTLACDLSHIRASTLTAVEVVGGVAQRVRAGVGTTR